MEEEFLCNVCTKKVDTKQVGMRCSACTQYFHNMCTSSPVKQGVWNSIVAPSDWVKVYCPKCMDATKKTEKHMKELKENMEEIKQKVTHTVMHWLPSS